MPQTTPRRGVESLKLSFDVNEALRGLFCHSAGWELVDRLRAAMRRRNLLMKISKAEARSVSKAFSLLWWAIQRWRAEKTKNRDSSRTRRKGMKFHTSIEATTRLPDCSPTTATDEEMTLASRVMIYAGFVLLSSCQKPPTCMQK